jgi:dissimilatory sulfite reductase (desulfoviridin) alpha/beta subunit
MAGKEQGFSLQMPRVGVIRGVLAKDIEVVGEKTVNLRTCARPYRNVYTVAQLRAIRRVIDRYGSGKVHLSPRHNLEIPEVGQKGLQEALKELYTAGLFPGGAGTSVRNIFTCPDWCRQALRPVQELGLMVSRNFGDADMPNKVTVSFAGCANGCSRPQHSDIGVIAIGRAEVGDRPCPQDCTACLRACRFDALRRQGRSVVLVEENCIHCAKCVEACREGVLGLAETGFRMLIGGKEGSTVRLGLKYADFLQEFEVLEAIDKVLSRYRALATLRPGSRRKKERLAETIQRLGLETFLAP